MNKCIFYLLILFILVSCKKEVDGGDTNNPTPQDSVVVDNPTDTTDVVDPPIEEEEVDLSNLDLIKVSEKMGGVSFESPANEFPSNYLAPIRDNVSAGWIALIPFAFSRPGTNTVTFSNQQWWGESETGVEAIAGFARRYDLKIMIKPQVWMSWNDWVGTYDAETEENWQKWEADYENYILTFARLAEKVDAELFCVGTEYRIAAVERPEYWRQLIVKVKEVYSGQVTYASNWDNYEKVTFWDDLDYIGIDSYFPLVEAATPEVDDLMKAWDEEYNNIKKIAAKFTKPILFTEYGYMSVDYSGWRNWENEDNKANLNLNMIAQINCYEAFFRKFWNEDWFAGGFIWKWHADPDRGGTNDKDYTPQNKPVEANISHWYGQ